MIVKIITYLKFNVSSEFHPFVSHIDAFTQLKSPWCWRKYDILGLINILGFKQSGVFTFNKGWWFHDSSQYLPHYWIGDRLFEYQVFYGQGLGFFGNENALIWFIWYMRKYLFSKLELMKNLGTTWLSHTKILMTQSCRSVRTCSWVTTYSVWIIIFYF